MIILIDSSQGTITVLADNGFPWKFNEKDPYVAKCTALMSICMKKCHAKKNIFGKVTTYQT